MDDRDDADLRRALDAAVTRAVAPPDVAAAMTATRAEHQRLRRRRAVRVAVALGVVAVGVSVAAAAVLDDGEDVRVAATPVTSTAGTTTGPTTAASTSAPEPASTTGGPAPSTAPSTSTPPTTTFVPPTGVVEELPLQGDGLGPLTFGTPAETVVAQVSALVGPPTVDTGYRPGTYDSFVGSGVVIAECTGPHTVQRALLYGNLELHFAGSTEADTIFVGYSIIDRSIAGEGYDPDSTWTLAAPSGLMPGAYLHDLAVTTTPLTDQEAIYDDGTGQLRIGHSWNDDAGRVVVISAGDQCLEGHDWPDD